MLRLLSLLFLGYWYPPCQHVWEEYKVMRVTAYGGVGKGQTFVRSCKHCGILKEFDFSI